MCFTVYFICDMGFLYYQQELDCMVSADYIVKLTAEK